MLDSEFYDELEIQDPIERESLLFESLARHIAQTREDSAYYQDLLKDISPDAIKTRGDLAALPVTSKSDLSDLQKKTPPLAGMTNMAAVNFLRIFQSPGPTYEPEAAGKDWWRMGRALFAAGVRPGDIIHNAFSYHMTPAGMMVESGAQAIGCTVVPAGTGQTEQQVQAIEHIRPNTYTGTPSFLKILLEKGRNAGADTSCLNKALVSGEALPQDLRREFQDRGIQCLQTYASADLGLIAYESKAMDGLIVDERLIVEIVRPGSGDPVPEGEIGEVVVTSLNRDYPMIRLATGDLSSVMGGMSPCGRTGMRLTGWKGRADQATKVKGMFVTPKQIAEVLKRNPEITKARLVVEQLDGADVMTLKVEADMESGGGEMLTRSLADTLQSICNLKGEAVIVAPGSLPNDGLVIEDKRTPG